MRIAIKIDLGALVTLTPEIVQKTLDDALLGIAESARAKWAKLAMRKFSTTRRTYLAGIQNAVLERPGTAVVELVGRLPNLLERGAGPFDIKKGLFNSPNVKVSKEGLRYRAVPFRHATPGTKGAVGIALDRLFDPHGSARSLRRRNPVRMALGAAGAAAYGVQLYAAIKRLRAGGRFRLFGDVPKLAAHHVESPVQDLKRVKGPKGTMYMTWRMASESKPSGFWHPGFEPANLAAQVSQHVQKIAPNAVRAAMRGLLGLKKQQGGEEP